MNPLPDIISLKKEIFLNVVVENKQINFQKKKKKIKKKFLFSLKVIKKENKIKNIYKYIIFFFFFFKYINQSKNNNNNNYNNNYYYYIFFLIFIDFLYIFYLIINK